MKNFKKLSAIFLSALLILGAVFVPMTVTTVSAADYEPADSLIHGSTLTTNGVNTSNGYFYGSSDIATMLKTTDGNTSEYAQIYGTDYEDKFVWMMNSYAKVESFELWAHTNTAYDFSFKLYVSDNTDDLFNDANLVYTRVREEGNSSGGFYSGNVAMPDGSDVYGAVVGMLVYETHATNNTIGIREFCVYGEAAEDTKGDFYYSRWATIRTNANGAQKSLINGKLPYTAKVGSSASNATGVEEGATSGQAAFSALTDGNHTTYYTNKTDIYGASYGGATNGWYQLTYELDSLSKLTGAAIYNATVVERAWDWAIYVGNDPETLYNGEPLATGHSFNVDSEGNALDGYQFGTEVLFANSANAVGKYVGFKITPNNSLSDSCARVFELQVFGVGNQSGTAVRWAKPADVTTESLLYGRGFDNAFVDKNAAGGEWSYSNTTSTYVYPSAAKMTDGTTTTNHADVYNGTNGKLIWALEETTDIESFVLYNHSSQYYNAAYEVYASDSLDTLFNLENQIYTYTFKDANGNIDPNEMQYGGKYVEFYGDKVKSANYVAVWLREGLRASKNPDGTFNSLDTGFRIAEVAFYGTKSENSKKVDKIISYVRTNESNYGQIATNLDSKFTYENNLLKAENVTVKNANGTIVTPDTTKLTNGTTTSEEFYGSYLNYEFSYFLGGLTTVEGFMNIRNNSGFYEGFKVYVGNSIDSLYTDENLVLDMSNGIKQLSRAFTTAVKFANPKTGMYLGIKWVNVNNYTEVRIAEIAAWGTQEDLGYTLAPSIGAMASADSAKSNANDVNLLRGLSATTGYYGSTLSSTGLYCVEGITDGVANQHYDFNFTAADYGRGSELLYDLGYVSTINEFAFWMTCATRQFSYEVYMGADYDTMFEAPVAVWDYTLLPDSLGQKFTFDEPKEARYIAVRLTDTRFGPNTDSYRISEIAAFGTLGGVDSEFVTMNGAEISADGKNISYSANYYFPAGIMSETIADFGTVVYPTTALAGAELTLDTVGASKASAAADDVMTLINALDAAGYKGIRANSTFSGADTVGATTKLTARAYITLSNGETYYSDPYNYSVTQIKRLAAKKYKNFFENDADYIANKGYNGAIETVWAELQESLATVSADKYAMVDAAYKWIENVKSTYGFEQEWIDNGVETLGDTSRLSAVIRKLMRGENVTLVQLGGSITEGYFATDLHGQAELVADFLNAAFPGQVTVKNAGIAATGATMGAYRLAQDVLSFNPDLVIVEYNINDARDDVVVKGSYEDIIRRLLSEDIAVIALHNLQYYSNTINAEGSATSLQNIGYFYGLPQARLFKAYYATSVYGQGEGMNYNADDAVHPNDQGHNAAAVVVANLIYNVMINIETQPTASVAIPTVPMTHFGGYIDDTATIYKAQDIEAGNIPVDVSGATYEADVAECGNADIKANHKYGVYTIPAGSTATIAVSKATDVLPLVAANANGSKAATFVVNDAEGNVLSEGTFSSYYNGSLTVEKSRIIEGTRFYNGEATDITITITAVDAPVYLAGVLACVGEG
ncbi:MAG: SGNH/GDSL hydrolase family protein [Clostridia bacterium]|nr:SGNH/GDSL hydrolase family protein [Clostridia bacterium]